MAKTKTHNVPIPEKAFLRAKALKLRLSGRDGKEWTWSKYLEALIDAFEELNPDVRESKDES